MALTTEIFSPLELGLLRINGAVCGKEPIRRHKHEPSNATAASGNRDTQRAARSSSVRDRPYQGCHAQCRGTNNVGIHVCTGKQDRRTNQQAWGHQRCTNHMQYTQTPCNASHTVPESETTKSIDATRHTITRAPWSATAQQHVVQHSYLLQVVVKSPQQRATQECGRVRTEESL